MDLICLYKVITTVGTFFTFLMAAKQSNGQAPLIGCHLASIDYQK